MSARSTQRLPRTARAVSACRKSDATSACPRRFELHRGQKTTKPALASHTWDAQGDEKQCHVRVDPEDRHCKHGELSASMLGWLRRLGGLSNLHNTEANGRKRTNKNTTKAGRAGFSDSQPCTAATADLTSTLSIRTHLTLRSGSAKEPRIIDTSKTLTSSLTAE